MNRLFFLLGLSAPALAGEAFLPHQIHVTDDAGIGLTGNHGVLVTVYSDAAGTTDVWRRSFGDVAVDHGYLSVTLSGQDDTSRDLDDALAAATALYVETTVDGVALSPLQRLGGSLGGGSLPGGCAEGSMPYMGPSGWTCTLQGSVLQEVSTTGSSTATGSWPHGAYTSSAGTQIMSRTITPTYAGSTIEVFVIGAVRENGNSSNVTGMGLFRNSETNAIALAHDNGTYSNYSHGDSSTGQSHHETLRWIGVTSDTNPITFKVRIGADSTGIACNPGICSMVIRERL